MSGYLSVEDKTATPEVVAWQRVDVAMLMSFGLSVCRACVWLVLLIAQQRRQKLCQKVILTKKEEEDKRLNSGK